MKKILKIIFIFSLLFVIINNTFANDIKTINVTIQNKDKILFPLTKDNFELVKNKLNIFCEWEVKFVCKKGWYNSINAYWCWIERTWNSLWNWFETICKVELTKLTQEVIRLNINLNVKPYYKDYPKDLDISNNFPYKRLQKRKLSCEASATSDILSAIKGYNITEEKVIEQMPKTDFFNKIAYNDWTTKIWWDPDVWFVWYIDKYNWRTPLQKDYEWYGVYEKPIQSIYSNYLINTEIINNTMYDELNINEYIHLRKLLVALNDWKYVQLWWDICTYEWFEDWTEKYLTQELADKWYNWINYCVYAKNARTLSWIVKNPDSTLKQIKWLSWEHAFYLLWYKWWIENPTKIIVWDTYSWKHTYDTVEWLRKWKRMENRSIIIK